MKLVATLALMVFYKAIIEFFLTRYDRRQNRKPDAIFPVTQTTPSASSSRHQSTLDPSASTPESARDKGKTAS